MSSVENEEYRKCLENFNFPTQFPCKAQAVKRRVCQKLANNLTFNYSLVERVWHYFDDMFHDIIKHSYNKNKTELKIVCFPYSAWTLLQWGWGMGS